MFVWQVEWFSLPLHSGVYELRSMPSVLIVMTQLQRLPCVALHTVLCHAFTACCRSSWRWLAALQWIHSCNFCSVLLHACWFFVCFSSLLTFSLCCHLLAAVITFLSSFSTLSYPQQRFLLSVFNDLCVSVYSCCIHVHSGWRRSYEEVILSQT